MRCRACGSTTLIGLICAWCRSVSFQSRGTDYAKEYNTQDTTYNQWLANVDLLHTSRIHEALFWGPHMPPLWRMIRREYDPRTTVILDYGCGQGLLMKWLKRAGYTVAGYEPSVEMSVALHKRGYKMFSSPTAAFDWFMLPQHGNLRRVVVMSEVLEHVKNPRAIIGTLTTCADLIITVPNESRVTVAFGQREAHDYPPNHLTRFTARGLVCLVGRKPDVIARTYPTARELVWTLVSKMRGREPDKTTRVARWKSYLYPLLNLCALPFLLALRVLRPSISGASHVMLWRAKV